MPAIISLLRGVNVGGHNQIKSEALRALYRALKLRNPQTLLNSGNVVFQSSASDLPKLARRIEDAIQKSHAFRPLVILRTAAEMRQVIAANPFSSPDLDPSKLLVSFLAATPTPECAESARALPCAPDEWRLGTRELYIYFVSGLARPSLSMPKLERLLGAQGTGRNWNTVNKLREIADKLDD
jgi:uncharacterized protein (DUF1697 family)